jgi:hypothetical protein
MKGRFCRKDGSWFQSRACARRTLLAKGHKSGALFRCHPGRPYHTPNRQIRRQADNFDAPPTFLKTYKIEK